jgi:uncharacterized protein YlxW (UPF0749 family)
MRKGTMSALIKILSVCFLLQCASSKPEAGSDTQAPLFTDDQTSADDNLRTETGIETKKTHIKQLQNELQNVKLQLEERQRLLEELNSIRKVLGADSLIDANGSNSSSKSDQDAPTN